MPELPEVETVARSLAPQVLGRRITAITHLDWPRMVETPDLPDFFALLPGRQIHAVGRRAKWLLLTLDGGWTLAFHLRMSGGLLVRAADDTPSIYTHLTLALDDDRSLWFEDQRKFGRVRLIDAVGMATLDAAHGPEPLEDSFTAETLAAILTRRRARLKPLLLDQAAIAGLGNIYASEALWLARLHPLSLSDQLDAAQVAALHDAIRRVLAQGIANQGSSLRNYRDSSGRLGSNQEHFFVYGRGGKPCERCGGLIERSVIGQRSTFFCPTCQSMTAKDPG